MFDNDGTLWCEHPIPAQLDFLLQQLADRARDDGALARKQPYQAALERDYGWLRAAFESHYLGDDSRLMVILGGILETMGALSVDELASRTREFFRTGRNPDLDRPYLSCAYRPMVELVAWLEENGFTCFIASGGGRDFMRAISEDVYGIGRDRVIGSSAGLEFRHDDGDARLMLTKKMEVVDDGPQKPIRIWSRVGRRPILAVGNSNGDIEMLRFAESSGPPSLCVLVHHDDSKREYAYDTGAEKALSLAKERGWTVVSMARDWATVFGEPVTRPHERLTQPHARSGR